MYQRTEKRIKYWESKRGKPSTVLGMKWKLSPEVSKKNSENRKAEWKSGKRKAGWKMSEESKIKIGLGSIGRVGPWKGVPSHLHPQWKGGISKNHHSTSEPKYKEWRNSVFSRDNWECKMCQSKVGLQAHHILPWRDFVELRYDINNGITLCLAHHPRKRAEEKRLIPTFQELVSVSNISLFN